MLLLNHVLIPDERYCESARTFEGQQYRTLGSTDAVLLTLCPGFLVLTDDLPLHSSMARRGYDVVNFTHILAAAGKSRGPTRVRRNQVQLPPLAGLGGYTEGV